MSTPREIADKLEHFARHIETWRGEAARLTLLASQSRTEKTDRAQLVGLEKTAGAIYADISEFQKTVEEIAKKSPEAAAQLAGVSDAIHLVLLEITELGVRLYATHSGLGEARAEA